MDFEAEPEGGHRLMCGDSTVLSNINSLLSGVTPDMVFADPPYGMNLDADFSGEKSNPRMLREKGLKGGRKYDNVIGDHDDFHRSLIDCVFMFNGRENFLFGADYYSELLPDRSNGSWIVWDKRLEENADRMYGSCFELCWSKIRHKRDIVRVKWAGVFGVEKEPDRRRYHPNQKPVELIKWFIDRWSPAGGTVADPFCGCGSTILAAHILGRLCLGIELSPSYVDVAVHRWQNLAGGIAVRMSDGMPFNECAPQ